MTEPGKYAPGLIGFPTPNTAADVEAYLLFLFPDPIWAQYVLGACEPLGTEFNWYEAGDMLPEEASEAFRGIVQQAPYNTYDRMVKAPFWDDTNGDDADDEAKPEDQDWFGVWDGETFLESLSYWAVTAFLATAFSEGAAIKFITPLRTFRLTLKKNPHGAKLLILMDSNIFQLIDLFSATDDVETVAIASPGSTLMLVHSGEHNPSATPDEDGNYTVEVIKSRLSADDVSPPNQRINPDTNIFQITVDGGVTWNDAECSDPRTSDAYLLPPLTPYEGIKCDVAARMVAQFQDTLSIFLGSGDAAQFATGVLALGIATIPLVGWFVDLLIVIGDVLIDIGQSNIEDAFTSTVYDDMRCAFFCEVGTDGQLTQEQLNAAYDKISAMHTGTVANVISELRFFYGDVAMNNAGVVRDETGDCTDCNCGCDGTDFTEDYTIAAGSAEIVAWASPPAGNPYNIVGGVPQAWVSGEGYHAGSAMTTGRYGVAIRIPFDCFQCDQIQVIFENQDASDLQQQIAVYKQDDLTTALWSNNHPGGGTPGIPFYVTWNPTEFLYGETDVYIYVGIQGADNFNSTIRVVSSTVPA